MKTIFISIYDGDAEKNILYTDVFKNLKSSGNRIILLVREGRFSHFCKRYEQDNVLVRAIPDPSNFVERLFYYVGFHSIHAFSIRIKHYNWLRARRYHLYLLGTVMHVIGQFKLWRWLIRKIYALIPDDYAADLFREFTPDLVFCANMVLDEDYRLIKMSKKLSRKSKRIITVGMIKSWDNITTKTFMRMHPDWVIVQNKIVFDEVMHYCDFARSDHIVIVGIPQFDTYVRREYIVPREKFFERIGVDSKKRLLFYAAPGDWKAEYDNEVVWDIVRAIDEHKIPSDVHILLRPHPKYESRARTIRHHAVTLESPGKYLGKDRLAWYFEDEDVAHLANTIYHSDIIINTESTLSLEAALLDRPTIAIGYDGSHALPYRYSVLRLYEKEHYRPLTISGGIAVVKSANELIDAINAYLAYPEKDHDGRRAIVKNIVYYEDGKSAERIANTILRILAAPTA